MNAQPVIVERRLPAPASRVWKALTDRVEMKAWYFDLADFRAEPGFAFQFWGGPSPDRQYLHHCEVTEVIPEKKLTYSWRYEGYAGISYVTFELFEADGGTLLRLTHRGLESFPQENTDLARHNFEAGWNDIIHTYLRAYIEGGTVPSAP